MHACVRHDPTMRHAAWRVMRMSSCGGRPARKLAPGHLELHAEREAPLLAGGQPGAGGGPLAAARARLDAAQHLRAVRGRQLGSAGHALLCPRTRSVHRCGVWVSPFNSNIFFAQHAFCMRVAARCRVSARRRSSQPRACEQQVRTEGVNRRRPEVSLCRLDASHAVTIRAPATGCATRPPPRCVRAPWCSECR